MTITSHFALFISNNIDKKNIITKILNGEYSADILGKKVSVFSEITLRELIENEERFGKIEMMQNTNRSIATLSGGEQKKALLYYCLRRNPEYLILDNPLDNLDIASQASLRQQFLEISKSISLIQLVNRKEDILDFIRHGLEIDDNYIARKPLQLLEIVSNNNNVQPFFIGDIPEQPTKAVTFPEVLVNFRNVTVKYGENTIIKDINWEIKPCEFWQLIGPNGAGKTTILSMIIGDNPKAFGQNIKLFGKQKGSGEAVWDIKKMIGYFTPSMISLFARYTTVQHMLVSGLFDSIGLYVIPTERHLRLANEWLLLLGFQKLKNTAFYKLTMGQQRLIMIARAMIKHPSLLILDEPTAGLDDHNVLIISSLINKIAFESNTTIVYVSHRKEVGLLPKFTFELIPTLSGSVGRVVSIP